MNAVIGKIETTMKKKITDRITAVNTLLSGKCNKITNVENNRMSFELNDNDEIVWMIDNKKMNPIAMCYLGDYVLDK